MYEVRDSEIAPSSSTVKSVLAVAGVLVGVLLLICGGAAGYVAFTAPSTVEGPPSAEVELMSPEFKGQMANMNRQKAIERILLTHDPAVITKIAATIVNIDLPAEFEPIEADQEGTTRRVVFGKKTEGAALLKLLRIEMRVAGRDSEISADGPMGWQVLSIAETENGRTDTVLKATRENKKSRERELTVVGQRVKFTFKQGKRALDNKSVWKAWGAFATAHGATALIYMVPELEFDEDTFVRMVESIRFVADAE